MAFVPAPALPSGQSHPRILFTSSSPVICSSSSPSRSERVSRRALLTAAAVAAAAPFLGRVNPASAASGSGLEKAVSKFFFPKQGFNAPETIVPGSGVIDRDLLSSKEGKEAVETLRKFQSSVSQLYTEFKEDDQVQLSPRVSEIFSISDLRSALNTFDEAFDEKTQKETDILVRGIIQDIGELKTAAALKPGTTRTPKKIARTADWFEKLEKDFKRLLSFYV